MKHNTSAHEADQCTACMNIMGDPNKAHLSVIDRFALADKSHQQAIREEALS